MAATLGSPVLTPSVTIQIPITPPPAITVNEAADVVWRTLVQVPGKRYVNYKLVPNSATSPEEQDAMVGTATYVCDESAGPTHPKGRITTGIEGFSAFVSFPLEIQDQIWMSTLEPHSYSTLLATDWRDGEDEEDSTGEGSGGEEDIGGGIKNESEENATNEEPHAKASYVVQMGRRKMRNIPLLWINRYTRQMAIKLYGDPQQGEILFNPALDSLRLEGHTEWGFDNTYAPFIIYELHDVDDPREFHLEPCPLHGAERNKELFQNSTCPEDGHVNSKCIHPRGKGDAAVHHYYGYSQDLPARVRRVDIALNMGTILESCEVDYQGFLPDVKEWTRLLLGLEEIGLLIRVDMLSAGGSRKYLEPSVEQVASWKAFVLEMTTTWTENSRYWPLLKHVTFVLDSSSIIPKEV